MDLPPELLVIHQPVRLRIMGLLYTHRDLPFTQVRDHLGLTDGNLASHAKKLESAGYVEGRRVLLKTGFEMRYRITRDGADAFRHYLATLRGFLEGLDGAPAEAPTNRSP